MKFGVIGVGYWGKNIVRNLARIPEISEIFIYDINNNSIKKILPSYPNLKGVNSLKELLDIKELNGVFVITPPETHYEIGLTVLEKGINLYIEKPFAVNSVEAENLIKKAKQKGLILMSGHTFLYSSPVIKIKELIKNKEIGKIEYISFRRINLGIHQQAVNVVWDLLPHDLSMILYWLGEDITFIEGKSFLKTSFGKHPDVASIHLKFKGDILCEGLLSWLSPKKMRETIIVGNKKMIIYNDTEPEEKIKIYDKKVEELEPQTFGEYQLSYRIGDVISPRLDTTEPLFLMIKDFIDSIKEKKEPKSNGNLGLRVSQIIEKII